MASLNNLSVALSLNTDSFEAKFRQALGEWTAAQGYGLGSGTVTTASGTSAGYVAPQSTTVVLDNTAGLLNGPNTNPCAQPYPIIYGEMPGHEPHDDDGVPVVYGGFPQEFSTDEYQWFYRNYYAPDRMEVLERILRLPPRQRQTVESKPLPRRAICLDGDILEALKEDACPR